MGRVFEFKKECIWYLESEDSILMRFERFETEANLLPEGFHNFDDYSNWHCRYVLGSSHFLIGQFFSKTFSIVNFIQAI